MQKEKIVVLCYGVNLVKVAWNISKLVWNNLIAHINVSYLTLINFFFLKFNLIFLSFFSITLDWDCSYACDVQHNNINKTLLHKILFCFFFF